MLQAAAARHLDFILGLYADPIFLGDYPQSVKDRVPSLSPLTAQEKASLTGSVDYFALNHYTSYYVKDDPSTGTPEGVTVSYYSSNGVAIGQQAESSWLYVVPWGFKYVSSLCKLLYHGQRSVCRHQPMPKSMHMNSSCKLRDKCKLVCYEYAADASCIGFLPQY